MHRYSTIIPFISLILISCQDSSEMLRHDDSSILAQVGNRKLYESDCQYIYPESATSADSQVIRHAYVQDWITDALFLNEAKKKLPSTSGIDSLVKSYRKSLLSLNYENQLKTEFVSSSISQEEIDKYYSSHEENYRYEGYLYRLILAVIDKEAEGLKNLEKKWKSSYSDEVTYLIQNEAIFSLTDDEKWYRPQEITDVIPPDTKLSNLKKKVLKTISIDNKSYYLYLLEKSDKDPILPQKEVSERIKDILRHQKQISFIENYKMNLYKNFIDK